MPSTKSKKFSVFVAILVLLAGILIGGFLFVKTKAGSANISDQFNYLLGKEKSTAPEDKNADSDNDGLADLQETIYHTDRNNPDTDNDGYLDGEEVASGYNPTKKAPNDIVVNTNSQNPRPLPKNLTKAVSLKLSQAVVNGKIKSFDSATGEPLTADELENQDGLQQAMEEAISQQINEFLLPDILDKDIEISEKTGKDESVAYFNAIGNAVDNITSEADSEMKLFSNAIDSRNFSELERVQKIYQDGYQNLEEVTVPSDLVAFHKGLLGVIWVTNNIYSAVKNIDDDPLKTAIALHQYVNITQEANKLMAMVVSQMNKY